MRSLQITVDTLDGKDIEEDDDIDKEIALFKRTLDKDQERKEIYNWSSVSKIIAESSIPLFPKFISKLSQFDELFHSHENRIIFSTDKSPNYDLLQRMGGYMISTKLFPESLRTWVESPKVLNGNITCFGLEYLFKGYKFAQPYDLPVFLRFSFEEYNYSISYMIQNNDQENYFDHYNYDQLINGDDINNVVNEITKIILGIIKGDRIL